MQEELNKFFSEKKHLYNPYSKLQEIKLVNIGLASSEQIRKWAEKKLPNGKILGQVTNANTLHHKTFKPLKGGLFCERVFGPVKDFQCSCGKTKKFTSSILAQFKEEKIYKNNFSTASDQTEISSNEEQERERIFCPICDVEYTWSVIRRYQLGYIQLVAPVTHLWYLKGSPSYLSLLLDMKRKKLESVVYCSENMTLETINSIIFSKQFFKEGPFPFVFEKKKGASFSPSPLAEAKGRGKPLGIFASSFSSEEEKKSLSSVREKKYSFLKSKDLDLGQSSGNSASIKPTSSLYKSWEKIIKNIETKQSLNNIDSINRNRKELVFSKTTSYLSFLKRKAKKASIQKSLKPKRVAGWRNLKIQTLNSFFDHFTYFKKEHLNTGLSIPVKIFLKLKNYKKMGLTGSGEKEKFLDFLKALENNKVFYKIAHKKVQQIILKIQIELLKKNMKEILDNNFLNVNSTLNPSGVKRSAFLDGIYPDKFDTFDFEAYSLGNFFPLAEAKGRGSKGEKINQKDTKKQQTILNEAPVIFNNFESLPVFPYSFFKGVGKEVNFLFRENRAKEKTLEQNNKDKEKTLEQNNKDKEKFFFDQNNKKEKKLEFFPIIKSILIFRIKKEILNSKINKIPYFLKRKEKNSFLPINNTQAPMNFFNKKKNKKVASSFLLLLDNKRTNFKFFDLSLYANNLPLPVFSDGEGKSEASASSINFFKEKSKRKEGKNFTISNHSTLDLKEKKKILFVFAFFLFNFFFPFGQVQAHKQKQFVDSSFFEKKTKQPKENNLKIIRINTLNKIIENLGLHFKGSNGVTSAYISPTGKNSVFSSSEPLPVFRENKAKERMKRSRHFVREDNRIKKKTGEEVHDFVYSFEKRKKKEKLNSVTKQNYSLYCISHRFCWENEKDWSNFIYFFSAPTKMDDIPISTYIERIPSTFHRPFSGAKVLQTLLAEFHFQEFKKMDRQNRILLYELNKQIQKDFSLESQLSLFSSAPTVGILNSKTEAKGVASAPSLGQREKKSSEKKDLSLFPFFIKKRDREKRQKRKFVQKRDQLIRRTKFIRKLFRKNSQPESMILSSLPVLPPDLRPILKIQDQIAASDLNRLYQRVLYRNERLKKFLKDSAMSYSYEMKYAQRLLQEAVDNLLQNGKAGGTPERDSRGRLLKSLSEILKGKQGRFRQHLLGKRVDYSGRSVIVVGPQLKIHECGLPKEMALELFLPFLLKRLIHLKIARTVIGAKTILKNNSNFAWEILYEVMQNYPVLLNRAPTLHRLGIQAFQPKLVDGRAILLHPLVCPAFNADFDGDQMAVHIPLTVEARSEAWKLMCSGNHFFSPATGDPLLLPSQDMVLGCYYLTTEKKIKHKTQLKQKKITANAKDIGKNNIHNIVWIKWDGSLENVDDPEDPLEMRINSFGNWNEIFSKSQYHFDLNGLLMSKFIRTTNGRLFFNEMLSFFSK